MAFGFIVYNDDCYWFWQLTFVICKQLLYEHSFYLNFNYVNGLRLLDTKNLQNIWKPFK